MNIVIISLRYTCLYYNSYNVVENIFSMTIKKSKYFILCKLFDVKIFITEHILQYCHFHIFQR